MSLLRFLGIGADAPRKRERAETETVRRISAELERLPADQARYLAAFAYVLARVAHADLEVDASELAEMERIVRELSGLPESQAALVVQIAKSQAQLLGGTENYVVTREFRNVSTKEQRVELLRCVYAVAAADGNISSVESAEARAIADELGFTPPEANAVRAEFRDRLSELRGD